MGVFKKHGSWYIDYYVNGRRKREKVGPNKRQAELVLKKRKVQIAEGKFFDIKNKPKVKFEEMARTYLESYSRPNKRSWRRNQICINNLRPHFGGKFLDEITPLDIEDYKRRRVEKVKPRTVNIEVKLLKAMYNKAIAWGQAEENPVNQVKLFQEKTQRVRYLEKEEIQRLLAACATHLKPIVVTALNTGLRKREILPLKWEDVDFKRRFLYIKDSKGGVSREVPMNQILCQSLKRLWSKKRSEYVFCDRKGRPYGNVRKSFSTALKQARIKDFRFHDLRHTFASHLVMDGVDLKTVQELMGHKSIRMTMRYAHLSPRHKREAIDNLWSGMDTIWTPSPKRGQK